MNSGRTWAALWLVASVPLVAQTTDQSALEKEAVLGRRLADEFRQHTTPIDNPEVQLYLDGIGRRLTAQMPEARLPFTFEAVAEAPCNAEPYALPGGYVFVFSSLFLAAADEYEFTRMLAHAMAHLALRPHKTPSAKAMASIPLVFSFGCPEDRPMGLRSTRERDEREADALAIETLQRAGLHPGEPAPSAEFAAAQQQVRAHATPAERPTPPSLLRKTSPQ